ncbi:hypothetical protein NW759_001094 [Fusarium solani]|nr:hypothetical protein NW759_001094 [Fusarium solani]
MSDVVTAISVSQITTQSSETPGELPASPQDNQFDNPDGLERGRIEDDEEVDSDLDAVIELLALKKQKDLPQSKRLPHSQEWATNLKQQFNFADYPEEQYPDVWSLARRRFKTNTNSWKSRTLAAIKTKVQELEEKEPKRIGFGKWKKVVELHAFFAQQYNAKEFKTIFTWLKNWI